MSALLITSLGNIYFDLYYKDCPLASKNFIKLCKIKFYTHNLIYSVQKDFIAQSGSPSNSDNSSSNQSIYGIISKNNKDNFFKDEIRPKYQHNKKGLLCTANIGPDMNTSTFYITLSSNNLISLNGKHTIFGEVTKGFDVLDKINDAYCDEDNRPYQNIRIIHCIVLNDPFEDLEGMVIPEKSPEYKRDLTDNKHLDDDFDIDKFFKENDTEEKIKENIRKSTKNKKNKKINLNPRKDSNKSCHNTPNKKFRHIISHNYDKKVNNLEKKLNINMNIIPKASESTSLTNTPKNMRPKNAIYQSNRNLTNIKISSQAVENKDIHLEMNGKQETIINYTNQEMVDDENEYMVECFKVLLKLDLSKQPRCKSKVNFNFENSPSEKNKKKIALFDLDETLVHCAKDQKGLNGDSVNIKLPTNKVVNVGLNIRPHWKEALDLIKNHYHIVVYTASHQSYADAVLDYLDKENKYFQYRLYRNHCVQCDVDGIKFYVKDLDTLNEKYNLKDVVLIDNSVLSFAYHLNNGIPIVPYIEQKEDSQLLMLAYYLLSIAKYDDLTQENKKHINIEHFILQVKNLENEEEEENDDEDEGEGKNDDNNIIEEEKKENTLNNNNTITTDENKNEECNDNNEKNIKKEMNKQSSFDSKKYGKKLSIRKSEKAL